MITNKYPFLLLHLILILNFSSYAFGQEISDMPHGDDFKIACETCHTTEGWRVDQRFMIFNHDQTGFALLGEHKKAECRSCHESLVFNHIGHACVDCHTDIHKNELGIRCENCHTSENWENRQDVFQLHESNEFPLIGVHALLDCESCHQNQQTDQYKMTPVECKGCHLTTFMKTLNPAHQKAGLSLNCEDCHLPNTADWNQAVLYSHTENFPLEGGHAGLECADCHSEVYSGTPANCVSCHQKDYNSATEPNHVTFGFPTTCERCHNTTHWTGTSFDHVDASGFALTGIHSTIQCIDCHVNNQLTGLPRDCYGCHENDFITVTDPNHQQNGFSHNCLDCHNETAWSPADFDHDQTNFPLTGAHQTVNCVDCHQSGQWSGIASECFSCHESDYNGANDPNHVSNNFDKNCTVCHSTNTWDDAEFDHNLTQFPLEGAHASVNCIDCHVSGYANTPFECVSCHETDYNNTTDPPHAAQNFPTDCKTCHTSAAWEPANFDHAQTNFPLTGAHVTVTCTDCHQNNQWAGIATDCFSCHESDYNGTDDPNHVTNNFDHDCTVCHSTSNWDDAEFDHAITDFPLEGAHTSVNCIDCHQTGYVSTPMACVSCHESDYNNTTNPGHMAAQFPTDCESCHNASAWAPADWDHDGQYFPIYSGRHQGEWNVCADCHFNLSDYSSFECITCHEHSNQQDVDGHHREVNDYTYDSPSCYRCHPDGRAEGD